MHVLIISHYYPPLNAIASLRPLSFARYFVQHGIKVTVLTTHKTDREGSLDLEGYQSDLLEIRSVPYLPLAFWNKTAKTKNSVTAPIAKGQEGESYLGKLKIRLVQSLGFLIDYQVFWSYSGYKEFLSIHQKSPVNIVISTFSPPASHKIASKIKRKFPEVKWIADYRDLWSQNHIMSAKCFFKIFEKMMERRVVGCADCLTTVSIPLANDLASLFKGEKQVEVIYNGYETIPPEFNTSDRIDTKVLRIVYTGTIYKDRRDPSPLFLALNQLESEGRLSPGDVIIDFYGGENANLAQIIHQHNAAKWANIKGFISYKESLNVQKKSDVLLFLESNKPEARGVLTGKIFEYITSGIPIWGIGIDGDCATGQLIRDTQTGVVLGNDVTKIKEAILSHMISSERKMIKPNIDVIKQYSRDNQSQKLLNIISELIRT